MGRVPDRWFPYSSVGQPIQGTKFIAFKVPLKDAICRNMKPEERFTPSMLLEKCPRLSLVVDLTNTHRYYNPNEFISKGVLYEKIFCPGKVIPSDDIVEKFVNIVDDYLRENGDSKDSLIGVHCTHGLNRTAYFICYYMIKRLNIPAKEAVSAFEQARGHPIERQEYIQALIDMANGDITPKAQSLVSPLGSLYEERPVTKYAPRQGYHSRATPQQYNGNVRHYHNPLPNSRHVRPWYGPGQNGREQHSFQQSIYGNSSRPNILWPSRFSLQGPPTRGDEEHQNHNVPRTNFYEIGKDQPSNLGNNEKYVESHTQAPMHLPLLRDGIQGSPIPHRGPSQYLADMSLRFQGAKSRMARPGRYEHKSPYDYSGSRNRFQPR